MKPIIISLLLFYTLNAQNVWYVDRDATGANTGRSWTDAWTSLDSSVWMGNKGINWAIIGDGDSIYVSGGTDSTNYYYSPDNFACGVRRETSVGEVTPTFNETVIVKKAWQSGHNGGVYFVPRNDNTYMLFTVKGVSNVKFTGFNIVDTRSNSTTMDNGLISIYGSNNILEDCFVYNRGLTTGIYLSGSYLTVRNCFFDYEANSLDNGIDVIGMSGGTGNHIIEGNIIITRNSSPTTTSHRDMIQHGDLINPANVEVIVRNNLIMELGNSVSWNGLIYTSGTFADTVKWYIYNNILVSTTTASSIGGIFIEQETIGTRPWSENYWIFNNTIIINDDGSGLSRVISCGNQSTTDTVLIKNNLLLTDAPVGMYMNFPVFYYKEYYRQIDYNGYFEYGGLSGAFMAGDDAMDSWEFDEWQGAGNDVHSITGNSTAVIFADKYGETAMDYLTVTGRDIGVDMTTAHPELFAKFPDIGYDILGNPRSGTWDMGALEYQGGGQTNNINLRSKVFLEGPFYTNSMNTALSLPNTQPYNTAPWNYNGSESLGSGLSYVDWVLVELRNSSNPTQVVSRRAAILKNDGTLLDTDGSIGVSFSNVQTGSYYIAVFHRNHLAVMSANPVQLSANSQMYDFTTSLNKAYIAYEGNPMTELAPGKFGMYAGNGNGDYGISIADKNQVWTPQNNTAGYKTGDFNLSGIVDEADVFFYNLNNGKVSQLPNTQ